MAATGKPRCAGCFGIREESCRIGAGPARRAPLAALTEGAPAKRFLDLLDLVLQIHGAQFGVEINSDTSLLAETRAGGFGASERQLVFHAG